MIGFLEKWQTLIGAALGPFLAVTLSVFGYFIKSGYDSKRERRETQRRIEIGTTRGLNDLDTLHTQLLRFAKTLRAIATTCLAAGPTDFFLEATNFPIVREIYRDSQNPFFKTRSYFIHNKLQILDGNLKEINATVGGLGSAFQNLLKQNELQVTLMKDQPRPNIPSQHQAYARSLNNMADMLEEYANGHIREGVRFVIQIKVYNGYMRKRFGTYFWWKHEGVALRYFRSRTEMEKFNEIDSLERIDQAIEKDVDAMIREGEKRKTTTP